MNLPERDPRPALAGLALSMLLSSLGTSIANVALPTLAHAFDASFQSVQWIVLAYLLAITEALGAHQLDPLKTTVVQNMRSMTLRLR